MWIIFPGNVLYALFCPGGIRYDPAGKKRDAPGLYRAGAAGSAMADRQNGRLADLYILVSTDGMRSIIKPVCKIPADAVVCGYIAIAVRVMPPRTTLSAWASQSLGPGLPLPADTAPAQSFYP